MTSVIFDQGTPGSDPWPTTDVSEFARINMKRFLDTEEARYDIPAVLASASIYTGVAADGTAEATATWTVTRTYFDASGNPNRQRIRFNVAWSSRTSGW